ncbi:class I adenylate-forming enzyme family protein [Natrinema caseinilyticum]|uniref:class I adenylate-forming enzyme family protein n=1 Tax=Natrinema caseinilyticum TaxID=2961570 RepID=UPI0020C1CECC|nr:class I adenylate-forming enzyme family protein [Natrinema caseinilyticum]
MLEWPTSTIYEAVSTVTDRRPDDTALVFDDDPISYGDLRDRSLSFAAGLADRGIGEGDTVAVWLANRPEWVVTQLAASFLGASVVAVNTRYRKHELEYMLRDSGATALVLEESFLGREYLEMVADLAPSLSSVEPESFGPDSFSNLTTVVSIEQDTDYSAVEGFGEVMTDRPTAFDPTGDGDTPAVIFYTSGTTGDPKGCVHDNRSVLNHSYNIASYLGVTDGDVGLGAIPFCGSFGFNIMCSCLSHGIPLVVQPHFQPERTVGLVDRHDVTYFSATAQMYLRMIDADTFAPERVETLRRGAMFFANGYNEPDFERIEDAVGFPICQPYGLSEANTQIFVGDPEASMAQRKKVGGPLVHEDLEAKIVDPESREELPPGERGELALRGYNVMQRYLGKPKATAEVFDDEEWLYTGDLCERDEQGRLYYHSRIDDALRVRGFLVSPAEIEAAIDDHSAVAVSQVVGAPHPRHGQVPVAFVTVEDTVTGDEIVAYLEEQIADYKIPADVVVVEEFPRTEGPHGAKIQKNELRDRVEDRYQ